MGIIYCLTNPAMPGYVKIGRTDDLESRPRSLDNTSVPLPFECVYAVEVADAISMERLLHETFGDGRTRDSREFFEVGEQRVIAAMRLTGGLDVTPTADVVEDAESQRALNNARERRARFNFDMVGLGRGTVLHFWSDPEITCVIASPRAVIFEGEETSLSAAAATVMRRQGHYGDWINHGSTSVQGPLYWAFDGETMNERRIRLERGEDLES